jgi:hypothetical protein
MGVGALRAVPGSKGDAVGPCAALTPFDCAPPMPLGAAKVFAEFAPIYFPFFVPSS